MGRIAKVLSVLISLALGHILLAGPASATETGVLGCGGGWFVIDSRPMYHGNQGVGTVFLWGMNCREPEGTVYYRKAAAKVPPPSNSYWRTIVQVHKNTGGVAQCVIAYPNPDGYCLTTALSRTGTQSAKFHAGAVMQHYSNGAWQDYAVGGTVWAG